MNEGLAPRPASTVLMVRDGASGLEVFMVVRHHKIDFASGALVFPGGSVDADDYAIAADPARCGPAAGLDEQSRALRVAAVRETFEECGVLLARPRGSSRMLDGALSAAIGAKAKGRSFAATIAAEDLELALAALVPFAHWITPPILPKRFDTHFYIVAAPADQLALHDGSELVELHLDQSHTRARRRAGGKIHPGLRDAAQPKDARAKPRRRLRPRRRPRAPHRHRRTRCGEDRERLHVRASDRSGLRRRPVRRVTRRPAR